MVEKFWFWRFWSITVIVKIKHCIWFVPFSCHWSFYILTNPILAFIYKLKLIVFCWICNKSKTLKKIVERAKRILGEDTEVYLFGSLVRDNINIYLSDTGVLIFSNKINSEKPVLERAKIIVKLLEGIKGSYIFQIHLVNRKEFEWYKRFVDKMVKIGWKP